MQPVAAAFGLEQTSEEKSSTSSAESTSLDGAIVGRGSSTGASSSSGTSTGGSAGSSAGGGCSVRVVGNVASSVSMGVAVGVRHELNLGRSSVEAERSSAVGVAASVAQLGVTSGRRSWGDGAVVSVSVVTEQVGAVVVASGDLVVVARARTVGVVVVVLIFVIMVVVIVVVVVVVGSSRAQGLRTSGSFCDKLDLVASNHTEGVSAVGVTRSVRRRSICGGGWSRGYQTVVSIFIVAEVVGAVEMAAGDGGCSRNTRKESDLSEQHEAKVMWKISNACRVASIYGEGESASEFSIY